MASANAARGLAAMFFLYLHKDPTSVVVWFCFSLKHESNAYGLGWQTGEVTVEIEADLTVQILFS